MGLDHGVLKNKHSTHTPCRATRQVSRLRWSTHRGACFLMSVGDADGVDDAQGGVPLSDSMPLWNLVCPITNAIFEDPMVASDGRTYSKAALLDWLASRKERKLPVTSPFGDTITENFSPNERMAAAINKYRKQRR